jgi:hypothetical protein
VFSKYLGLLPQGIKQPWCGTDHIASSSAEIKIKWRFMSTAPAACMLCAATTLLFMFTLSAVNVTVTALHLMQIINIRIYT